MSRPSSWQLLCGTAISFQHLCDSIQPTIFSHFNRSVSSCSRRAASCAAACDILQNMISIKSKSSPLSASFQEGILRRPVHLHWLDEDLKHKSIIYVTVWLSFPQSIATIPKRYDSLKGRPCTSGTDCYDNEFEGGNTLLGTLRSDPANFFRTPLQIRNTSGDR